MVTKEARIAIWEDLPRDNKVAPNAVVYIDASGNLNVDFVGGGGFVIDQDELDKFEYDQD